MEETPFVQIECPTCGACYRIDKAKIPDNGAMATCRKCQSKFAVRKPESPTACPPEAEPSRPETPMGEPPRPEPPRHEPFSAEATNAKSLNAEPRNAEQPKAEPPRAEAPGAQPAMVKPAAAEPPEAAQTQNAPIPPGADSRNIVCPKCGFKQVHPFRCYKCGFVFQGQNAEKQNSLSQDTVDHNTMNQNITRQNAPHQSPPAPAPHMASPNSPQAGQDADSGEAEVIVKARFLPLMILLFLFKPRIEIDGQTHERSWGTHRFAVKSGRHRISVYFPYFFITRCGENSIDVSLKANETAYIEYSFQVPLIFLKGSIRHVPAQTGLVPFSPEGPSGSAFHGWYTTRAAVVTLLILFWPVGLLLLWISDEFSKQTKWVLTGIFIFIVILATMNP